MAKRGEGAFGVDPGRDPAPAGGEEEIGELAPELEQADAAGVVGDVAPVDPAALERNARGVLKAQGAILNAATRASGRGPDDAWLWTDVELDVICPAIASYAAKHAPVAGALENADLAVIAVTGATYALREAGRVRAYTAAHAEDLSDVDAGGRVGEPRFPPVE